MEQYALCGYVHSAVMHMDTRIVGSVHLLLILQCGLPHTEH